MKTAILVTCALLVTPGVFSSESVVGAEPIAWEQVHFDTLAHHRPFMEEAVDYLSSRPDSVYFHQLVRGQTWASIAQILSLAAKREQQITSGELGFPADLPCNPQEIFLIHSGHNWTFWYRLALIGQVIEAGLPVLNPDVRDMLGQNPTLQDVLDPDVLRVLHEMEAAFKSVLSPSPEPH